MVDFKRLRYFLAVAESLNFSRAAERLYISQSSLSQRIMELEDELETELFVRNKRGTVLTPAGIALKNQARELLHQMELMETFIRNGVYKELDTNKFTICVDENMANINNIAFMQKIATSGAALQTEYGGGNVNVFYHVCDYSSAVTELEKGLCDVVLADGQTVQNPEQYEVDILNNCDLLLFGKKSNGESGRMTYEEAADLCKNESLFLAQSDRMVCDGIISAVREAKLAPETLYMKNKHEVLLHVLSGNGLMVIPSLYSKLLEIGNLSYYPLNACKKDYLCSIIMKDARTPLADYYINTLKEELATL